MYWVAPYTQFTLLELAQIITPISSGILSIVLAFLYLNFSLVQEKQTDIMENQSEIQKQQVDLMERQVSLDEIQYIPDVEAKNNLISTGDIIGTDVQDVYSATLVNKGNGVANRLNLWCELLYDSGDGIVPIDDLSLEKDGEAFSMRPALMSFITKDQGASRGLGKYGGYLEPGKEGEFEGHVGLFGTPQYLPEARETYLFSEVLEILRENTINDLDIHLWLVYKDQTGSVHMEKIDSGHFDVYHISTLQEAFEGGDAFYVTKDSFMRSRIQNTRV